MKVSFIGFGILLSSLVAASVTQHSDVFSRPYTDVNVNKQPNNSTCSPFDRTGLLSLTPHLQICQQSPCPFSSSATPEPWTHPQVCTANTTTLFCVYTSSNIYNGRGISIVTKPHIALRIASFSAFTAQPKPPELLFPAPFSIEHVPGKGMGVAANRTIQRGESIFAHPIIGIFHNDAFLTPKSKGFGEVTGLFHQAVDQLPDEARAKFMRMAAYREGEDYEPIIEKLNTNTFGEDFAGEEHSIVVPETARLNHDCRPNAIYYFDTKTLIHYTHALRTIYAGEEITITYIDPLQSYRDRQRAIKRSWGFSCTCPLCTLPANLRKESDSRISLLLNLTSELETFNHSSLLSPSSPSSLLSTKDQEEEITAQAELLVELYEIERLDAGIADGHRIAALGYSSVGREWEAKKWAVKALEGLVIGEGPGHRETRDMRRLVKEGRGHWSWRGRVAKEDGKREKSCGCGCKGDGHGSLELNVN